MDIFNYCFMCLYSVDPDLLFIFHVVLLLPLLLLLLRLLLCVASAIDPANSLLSWLLLLYLIWPFVCCFGFTAADTSTIADRMLFLFVVVAATLLVLLSLVYCCCFVAVVVVPALRLLVLCCCCCRFIAWLLLMLFVLRSPVRNTLARTNVLIDLSP